ncbi:MAG: hexapeptide transferase [Bacteroidetes bacterium]|nr:MAG: hexapeptide transferase [Bacteroidota bacterium]
MIKRLLYLGYYYKNLDKKKFYKMFDYVVKKSRISRSKLRKDIISSSLKYNISLQEFFLFRFYEITQQEKEIFAGTGYMYKYQLLMNPRSSRNILEDKLIFLKEYAPFVKHNYLKINEIDKNSVKLNQILQNNSGKIVLKSSDGQCGIGIEVRDSIDFSKELLINRLKETGNDFVEDFVQQHDNLNELSPSGLNTIRIITQLNKNDKVEILGARLRITINSSIDNLAAGNIAASIDENTGVVNGMGVYSDITKNDEEAHPITGVKIIGFQTPYWKESLQMVKDAALLHKQNRSIGWDVAITNNGPELIEGNHDWCKLLWQLPVKKGLKPILEKYEKEYK